MTQYLLLSCVYFMKINYKLMTKSELHIVNVNKRL